MVTRGRGKGRGRGRERGRGQGQESDQGVNEELLGVHSSRVEQTTSSNALSREPDPNTEVDETSVGLGNDPIIGEPSDDISSQSRRRGPNRGSQVPEHPDQRAFFERHGQDGIKCQRQLKIWFGGDLRWDELVEKHWSGENYKRKCKIAQKNRMTEKDGSITKHTGGSIPQGAHKLRMEKDLGREVGELELFHRTHRRNKGIGEFVDNKSKKVNEDYMSKIGGTDASTQSSFDFQSWCEVIGGPSKGHIYGFGRSQSSDGYSKTSVTSTFRESEERFNELRKEMDEKYNELTMKMQEEFLRREEESKRILEGSRGISEEGRRFTKKDIGARRNGSQIDLRVVAEVFTTTS
ncbi:UNVERIFIED_CONTAM: hypothetical protein Scaly_2998200 [Sesamum calycinum]|uniref:Uncharacterized protein n=1 Tax=Sesamum calycinum TaxID=2727403 RepID=A0AAW2KGL7_9LAMI